MTWWTWYVGGHSPVLGPPLTTTLACSRWTCSVQRLKVNRCMTQTLIFQCFFIAQQMLYNHPQLFDQNVPAAFSKENPHLAQLVTGGHVTEEPWNNKATLTSLAGHSFASFAKSTKYGKGNKNITEYLELYIFTVRWILHSAELIVNIWNTWAIFKYVGH